MKKNDRISVRVTEPEIKRLDLVVQRVRERNQYMDRTKVLREIIGFDPRAFVTADDLLILRGGEPDDKSPTGELSKAAGGN